MAMVQITKRVNKPADMAKDALRKAARTAIAEAGWPEKGVLTVQIGEFIQSFDLAPTASLKDGRIMYHAGGRDQVNVEGTTVTLRTGANVLLDRAVAEHAEILKRFGNGVDSDAEMEAGEKTE